MTETHLQIKAQYEAYLLESEAFETKGVKAAAARARIQEAASAARAPRHRGDYSQ